MDNEKLGLNLYFKGGTCAAMRGILDRFSVDLDFDAKPGADEKALRTEFYKIFKLLGFKIKDESKRALEFFVKVDALNQVFAANEYEAVYLPDIDRVVNCQTVETMFANKLVAPIDRWERNGTIAGRDIYDIHHFYLSGLKYLPQVIEERTGMTDKKYFSKLADFIESRVTGTVINEDLNALLPVEKFQMARKTLKSEVLVFLKSGV